MSISGQILAYLKVLAWPVTALAALVIFRVAIRGLLGGIQEFEGFGIKAKLGQQIASGIASAAAALAESPVAVVTPTDHDHSPHSRSLRSARGPSLPILAISQVQAALAVSSRLAKPDPDVGDDTAEAMRSYLNWLDTAVTAVVSVLATSGQSRQDLALPQSDDNLQADLTAQRIERQFSALTGVSGWRGVIEARDTLRDTIAHVCGQGAAIVTRRDAHRFVTTVIHSLDHWQNLVREVGKAAGHPAPADV
jgi:hypothetical protein